MRIKNPTKHLNDRFNRINNWETKLDNDEFMSDKAFQAYEAKVKQAKRELARTQVIFSEIESND